MSNLYIPKTITVGFQKRSDTFTEKLAYIIYTDDKGALRKEASWQGWRDQTIEPVEFENSPRNGFLFNKGIRRHGYNWGSGRSVIRVYDPRDFEFEINVDNLIGILMHSDVSKRDIIEECVFAWEGTDLVLLPVNSDIYQASLDYTKKQALSLSAKSLIKGHTYSQKKNDKALIYIGYYPWYEWRRDYSSSIENHKNVGKKHIFFDGTSYVIPSMTTFSSVLSEEVAENYPELVENFFKTFHSQPTKSIQIEPQEPQQGRGRNGYGREFYKLLSDTKVSRCNLHYSPNSETFSISFLNGNTHVVREHDRGRSHDKLLAAAKSLGMDVSMRDWSGQPRMTEEQMIQAFEHLMKTENYIEGNLMFVLENDTILPYRL